MNFTFPPFATAIPMPDISAFLTKGSAAGDGVMLRVGDMYVWGLLGGGPLLILAGLWLMKTMYGRVRYFALDYGEGSIWGRMKAITPFIAMGLGLMLVGGAATWLGWLGRGYSATLTPSGLVESWEGHLTRYDWSHVRGASQHIRSTDFWISFANNENRCRVRYQQRFIGEKLQDRAIAIAESALSAAALRGGN